MIQRAREHGIIVQLLRRDATHLSAADGFGGEGDKVAVAGGFRAINRRLIPAEHGQLLAAGSVCTIRGGGKIL